MAVEKISISLEKPLVKRIQQIARREKTSVSAVAARALERESRNEALKRFIEEFEAEHGVITPEEVERARKIAWPD
jgi:predicted transcriptional regulator